MKKYLLTIAFMSFYFTAFCQNNTDLFLSGYGENNYSKYFDSIHKLKKSVIQDLSRSYYGYVVFKVDSNAKLKEFEIIQIPSIPLPEIVRKYINDIFFSTNEKWRLGGKGNSKMIDKKLLFSVSLIYEEEKIEDRVNDSDVTFQFGLTELKLHPQLKGYNLIDQKQIYLSF